VGCPGAKAAVEPSGSATDFDEFFCVFLFGVGDGEGFFGCEVSVVECAEEDVAWVSDDVDGFEGVVELWVLVGELEVCFDVGWAGVWFFEWHFSVDVGDSVGDICGALWLAVEGGVEHEAEPSVAAFWVGGDPDDLVLW